MYADIQLIIIYVFSVSIMLQCTAVNNGRRQCRICFTCNFVMWIRLLYCYCH